MNYSIESIAVEPLGRIRAKHLLNRALFGPKRAEIDAFSHLTIDQALDQLLSAESDPDPPLFVYSNKVDPDVPFGSTWVDAPINNDVRYLRKKSLRSWWVGLIMNQSSTLREKMVMFWHNHFVTEVNVVGVPAYLYDYHQLLRKYACGNYKSLTGEMSVSTAMLRYLDGTDNTAGSPNENYARELFELFTIGKGPLIAEGDYSNYTEDDIQEGARVLTGWKIDNNSLSAYFNDSKHDKESKTFSSYYDNHTISNEGDKEYLSLIDMILSKRETARHLVRKLYRWFIYYEISEDVEQNIIEPLTDTFYNNDYELAPVLRQLLSSEHFFDHEIEACYIKSPADFTLGLLRTAEIQLPEDLNTLYEFWNIFFYRAREMDMELGTPPNVAGWPAYYLGPQFNQLWINSATLPLKSTFITKMISSGYYKNGVKLVLDLIHLAELTSNPSDVNLLIEELCQLFLPKDISQLRRDEFKEALIPGLPDFEWTVEWNKYKEDPEDSDMKRAIENALKNFFEVIFNIPEFHVM